jgi:DNA-binding response OmpR family regulator
MGSTGQRLLLVEDDLDLAESIGDFLARRGWQVAHARHGALALRLAAADRPAVIILDRAMPGLDGIAVCRALRSGPLAAVPILMLTAADSLPERLEGFAAGVDDYLVKPFAPAELEARLTALIRRSGTALLGGAGVLRYAGLELDPATREVRHAGHPVELTRMGFSILEILLRHAPAVVPRAQLERELWGDEPPGSDALRSHVFALRTALDAAGGAALLRTHRGIGYQIHADEGAP